MVVNNKKSSFLGGKFSEKPPFRYIPEKFTLKEKKVLLNYFTNVDGPVFAIHNLPQEVIGAMFSRYSRSSKSVRRLFLDEFHLSNKDLSRSKSISSDLFVAKKRTGEFYKKVFAEYGDDSVIQMGSVHIAFEFISQLIGAKAVEDQRVASSYIEKSTRYVDFGSKSGNRYLYMEPVEIMKSRFKKEFINWCNKSFELYIKYLPRLITYLEKKYPIENQIVESSGSKKIGSLESFSESDLELLRVAYKRALRAKALDTVRFFLPLTTVTNLGAHYSGQAAELTINKMLSSPYSEVRYFGKYALNELLKVAPNFLQNIDHPFGDIAREYRKEINNLLFGVGRKYSEKIKRQKDLPKTATLISYDKDADIKIASEILFEGNYKNLSKKQIVLWAKTVKKKEGKRWSPTLLKIIKTATPKRDASGRNRRQKLPRVFEHAEVEVEFFTDIGAYKDLQRNRLSTTQRQLFSVEDLYIPEEYKDESMKDLLKDYLSLHKMTKTLNSKISKLSSILHASQYILIMGNKVRYTVRANLRQWCFFAELRTISGGHPSYRQALQKAAQEIIKKMPFMKDYFTHIDWTPDYGLGRLKAEINTQKRLAQK